jgi:resuscitation-promoting factor RpfB
MTVLFALAFAGCAGDIDDAASAEPGTTDTAPAKVKHKTVRIKKSIQYAQETVKTSALDKGETRIDQEGQPGVRLRVVRLTLKNGVVVARDLVNTFVRRQPVAQVTLVGTHVEPKPEPEPASNCDPNYAGACVPVASDVDCAGGSGDGPEYVEGPVTVVGDDVYDLNRDDDNIACDS